MLTRSESSLGGKLLPGAGRSTSPTVLEITTKEYKTPSGLMVFWGLYQKSTYPEMDSTPVWELSRLKCVKAKVASHEVKSGKVRRERIQVASEFGRLERWTGIIETDN